VSKSPDVSRLENFCKGILKTDRAVRFAGITNAMGSLLSTAYRSGLVPILEPEDTARYAVHTAMRAATRDDFESKLGRTVYVLARYPKLIRATVTIGSQEKKHLLMVSFDIGSDFVGILDNKILPYLKRNENLFK